MKKEWLRSPKQGDKMRLIDADVLAKHFTEQIRDFLTEADQECFRYVLQIVDSTPTAKAIPIDWLQKEMVTLIYDGDKVTDDDRFIVNRLIAIWEKTGE